MFCPRRRLAVHRWRFMTVLAGMRTDLYWRRCRDCGRDQYVPIAMPFASSPMR